MLFMLFLSSINLIFKHIFIIYYFYMIIYRLVTLYTFNIKFFMQWSAEM